MSWYKVLNNENGTPNPIPLSKTESEKNFFSEKVERIAKSNGLQARGRACEARRFKNHMLLRLADASFHLLTLAIPYARNDFGVTRRQEGAGLGDAPLASRI